MNESYRSYSRACCHMFPRTGLCLARHYVDRSGTALGEPAGEAGGNDQRSKVSVELGELTGKLSTMKCTKVRVKSALSRRILTHKGHLS